MRVAASLLAVLAITGNSDSAVSASSSQKFATTALVISQIGGGNEVSGYVFDQQHRPLENVNVELLDSMDALISRGRTNGSGRYVFGKVGAGTFLVKVLPRGTDFETQTQRINIVNFNQGSSGVGGFEKVQLDFILVPRGVNNSPASRVGVVFAQEVPEEARKAYAEAIKELENKHEGPGIAGLKRAVGIFPTYYVALDRLGMEYIKRKEYVEAENVLARAVEVNPKEQSSLYALGFAQYNLKKIPEAVASLTRSLALNPNSINTQLWLGIALRQTTKLDEAEAHLKKASELGKGKIADAHWQLALLYGNQLKRYKDAADALELFLAVQPDSLDAEKINKLIATFREKAKAK